MALLFNVQRTAGLIGRRLGGIESAHSIAGNFRPERENWFYGAHSPNRTGGTPNGHLPPSSWVLPQKAGGLSSINFAGLTINGSALGALGVNAIGAAALAVSADGIGQLVASAVGAAVITIDGVGNILAALPGTGTAAITLAAAGTASALAWAQGSATLEIVASLIAYARGHMAGSTDNVTALTADAVAAAVWSYVTRELTASGTLTAEQATQLREIAELHGLDPAKPLTVTATSRAVGTIAQTITDATGTTTVTRAP